jgi:hypothetical protein
MATQKEATLRLYQSLNSPAKAGKVWVQYERKVIDAALDVLKQIMTAQGYDFRPRPECAVGGRVAPRALCGHIITGGKYCGKEGECAHKKTPNVQGKGLAR